MQDFWRLFLQNNITSFYSDPWIYDIAPWYWTFRTTNKIISKTLNENLWGLAACRGTMTFRSDQIPNDNHIVHLNYDKIMSHLQNKELFCTTPIHKYRYLFMYISLPDCKVRVDVILMAVFQNIDDVTWHWTTPNLRPLPLPQSSTSLVLPRLWHSKWMLWLSK